MAAEENCFYIDLYSALADDDKALPAKLAQEDGIHMNQEGCLTWINYLLMHKTNEDNQQ